MLRNIFMVLNNFLLHFFVSLRSDWKSVRFLGAVHFWLTEFSVNFNNIFNKRLQFPFFLNFYKDHLQFRVEKQRKSHLLIITCRHVRPVTIDKFEDNRIRLNNVFCSISFVSSLNIFCHFELHKFRVLLNV